MILKLQIVTFFVWTKMLETAMEKELIHKAKKKKMVYICIVYENENIYMSMMKSTDAMEEDC